MPRYRKRKRNGITKAQLYRALNGGKKKYLLESRGHEVKSPMNDWVTWQALCYFGTNDKNYTILNTDGQETQTGWATAGANLRYRIMDQYIKFHGRNTGAHAVIAKFWVLQNLQDIYMPSVTTAAGTNSYNDWISSTRNLDELMISDLCEGWAVDTGDNFVQGITNSGTSGTFSFDPNVTNQSTSSGFMDYTDIGGQYDGSGASGAGSGLIGSWPGSGTTNLAPAVLYGNDGDADDMKTWCLTSLNSLGLHNSVGFLKKYKILKKGSMKLNPGDDFYITQKLPSKVCQYISPWVSRRSPESGEDVIYCDAGKGVIILMKCMGVLGCDNTLTSSNNSAARSTKSGYMQFQIPYEFTHTANWQKENLVDHNLAVRLHATDGVEFSTLNAGTQASVTAQGTGS